MAVQIASKTASGSVVTVQVSNSSSHETTVSVSLHVRVAGQTIGITSGRTAIPANSTAPVTLQSPGTVEFIEDDPDPTVMIWED